MTAPLCDSRGEIRYFIGAQVDVSGLVKEFADMESLERLVAAQEHGDLYPEDDEQEDKKDELQELATMFNMKELDVVRRWGGRMHREPHDSNNETNSSSNWKQERVMINDLSSPTSQNMPSRVGGKLSGIYEHYLLVRPYPSLRILFASPSLRVPGILQSPFLSRIGGSSRIREELTRALADGRGVTAKVRWVSKNDEEGRNRWIHCTPLLGSNGQIGVWMVVIVDEEKDLSANRRFRQAPPIDPKYGRTVPMPQNDNVSWRDFAVIRSQGMLGPGSRAPSRAVSRARSTDASLRPGSSQESFTTSCFRLD